VDCDNDNEEGVGNCKYAVYDDDDEDTGVYDDDATGNAGDNGYGVDDDGDVLFMRIMMTMRMLRIVMMMAYISSSSMTVLMLVMLSMVI